MINAMKSRLGSAAGMIVLRRSFIMCSLFCRNHARKRTITGLAISEGCRDIAPSLIQRCAPCEEGMAKTTSSNKAVPATIGKIMRGLLSLR